MPLVAPLAAFFVAASLLVACAFPAAKEDPLPAFDGSVRIEGDAIEGRYFYAAGLENEKDVYYRWRRTDPGGNTVTVGKNEYYYGLTCDDIGCTITLDAVVPGYSVIRSDPSECVVPADSGKDFTVSRGDFTGGRVISMNVYRDSDPSTVKIRLDPDLYTYIKWDYNCVAVVCNSVCIDVLPDKTLEVSAKPVPLGVSTIWNTEISLNVTWEGGVQAGMPYSLTINVHVRPGRSEDESIG